MATFTDNYNLTKPTMNELADIRVLNGNMDTIDEIMHGSQTSIADAYDPTLTYDVDDLVMNGFLLYKCITAVTTPEAFDPTKWERTTAVDEGGGGGSSGGGINYSTTEQNTGLKWIDGSDIYQCTWVLSPQILLQDNSWVATNIPIGDINNIIDCKVQLIDTVNDYHTYWDGVSATRNIGSYINLLSSRVSGTVGVSHVTLQYTKTSS